LTAVTGLLYVTVTPADADVELTQNARLVERWRGNQKKTLLIGAYEVRCSASGYKEAKKSFAITEQTPAEIDLVLSKEEMKPPPPKDKPLPPKDKPLMSSIGIQWIYVEGGTFSMGGNGQYDGKPIHTVTVSSFYIGATEVTFDQYDAFCEVTGREKPNDNGWGRGKRPVINVSWHDAIAFCKWASEMTRSEVRLPTEAEWEYAARGGKKSRSYEYSGSSDVGNVAWYDGNSGSRPHDVATKQPNELGIYDMGGNVWEWCADWYSKEYYNQSPSSNPKGPESGTYRVLRGGSWINGGYSCRVAYRSSNTPGYRYYYFGFRCARTY
jgi:formylglycine-generating enzyme required for sulfatase activity